MSSGRHPHVARMATARTGKRETMNAASAIPAAGRGQAQTTDPRHAAPAARAGCVVMPFRGADHAGAAWLACREMALDRDEYEGTLDGVGVLARVPPLPGEAAGAYGERAASAVMVAYVFGWDP